jgi:hypothetical protein
MKKILFSALLLLAVNAMFAQKATQDKDGSWVLDGVNMTAADKTALLALLKPYETSYKLVEVLNAKTVSTYGKASISQTPISSKATNDAPSTAARSFIIRTWAKNIFTEVISKETAKMTPDVKQKVNAIVAKYAK